ncbi:MAG: PTS sugar transporter subunit IIA, partial [Eubacterium sp.]|nr:PTS sugar transporter subunit IIA [Eubacterium sp.]
RQAMIQADIEEREKIASQVFAEFGFALLHTRTKGVMRPSFSVCLTRDGKAFSDPYFKGISGVLVMLLPVDENIRINSDILGYISSSLIEDYDFLLTITSGDKSKIEEELSKQLRKYFNKCISQMQ